ncbi:MAG TPA: hypothetical protein VF060_12180 [Trebonia sp.]
MRLGKAQASGYVSDVAEEDVTQEPQTLAPEVPEPVIDEREQVTVTG